MSRGWQGGSTTAWRKTRLRILTRDQGQCRIQIPAVCTHIATCVHHTVGRGVSERDEDLVSACAPCNQAIGDPTPVNPPHKPFQWRQSE